MKADDGFAGAGGWDLGAAALEIEGRGIENMKEARETRDAAGLVTIHDDVWTFVPDGHATGKIDSPPCQTFSQSGKGSGQKALNDVLRGIRDRYYTDLDHLRFLGLEVGDERTALVLTPLHFATQYEYEWLAWEQVPAVLPVWEACADVLRGQGWHVWTGLLHAEQYGVPQARTRAALLASRLHPVTRPAPTHSLFHRRNPDRLDPGVSRWITMAEGIGHGLTTRPAPTITGGGTETGGAEPIAKIAERWASRPDWQPRPALDGDTPADCVWAFNRPSPTIVGTFRPDVVAKPGYRKPGDPPRQKTPGSIRITVAEAGVLQSFPPDYPWQGKEGKQYLQAGNAVPPLMAMHALAAAAGIDVREVEAA